MINEKSLGIVVLSLMFRNTSFADNLREKNYFAICEKYDTPHIVLNKSGYYLYDEEWHRIKAKYKAMPQKIEIFGSIKEVI